MKVDETIAVLHHTSAIIKNINDPDIKEMIMELFKKLVSKSDICTIIFGGSTLIIPYSWHFGHFRVTIDKKRVSPSREEWMVTFKTVRGEIEIPLLKLHEYSADYIIRMTL